MNVGRVVSMWNLSFGHFPQKCAEKRSFIDQGPRPGLPPRHPVATQFHHTTEHIKQATKESAVCESPSWLFYMDSTVSPLTGLLAQASFTRKFFICGLLAPGQRISIYMTNQTVIDRLVSAATRQPHHACSIGL